MHADPWSRQVVGSLGCALGQAWVQIPVVTDKLGKSLNFSEQKKKYNHEYLYHFAGGGCNADLLGLGSLVELVSCLTGNFFLSRK